MKQYVTLHLTDEAAIDLARNVNIQRWLKESEILLNRAFERHIQENKGNEKQT